MARGYVKAWTDWLEKMERLSDASKGRLLTAILVYAKTGEELPLKGNEAIMFPVFRAQIDQDAEGLERQTAANRANGQKGGRPKKPIETQENPKNPLGFSENPKNRMGEEEEKEEEKEKDKESYIYACAREEETPPTEDEVTAFCWEHAPHVNARDFLAYYGKLGWKDGDGKPVRSWRSKVLIWERNWRPEREREKIPDFIDEEDAL